MLRKIIPYILILALVLPSALVQTLPVVAAGNDGESVILTEENGAEEDTISGKETAFEEEGVSEKETVSENGTNLEKENVSEEESISENKVALEEVNTEGLEEGIYAVPLNSYSVSKATAEGSLAGTTISANMPAWNEHAMLQVASGGAISITFQIYNTIPYDYFQVMKWEESEELTFGLTNSDYEGNGDLANIKMGTFNVNEGYLKEYPSMEQYFTAGNNDMYDETVVVSRDSETGYTYLTMNLDSVERLDEKLVIKNAFCTASATVTSPVNTNFFIFEPENMIRIPDLEEYKSGGEKSVKVSDVRGNGPSTRISNLKSGQSLFNVQNLFGVVETTAETDSETGKDTLTIEGDFNEESFEGNYGVRYVRKLANKPIAKKTDADILKYYHPYYNTQFQKLDISDHQFKLTFNLTAENLVFGVPVSIKTQDNEPVDMSGYTDEQLDKLSSSYVMLHVLPEVAETVVRYDESGEVRLTSDSYVVREENVFYIDQDSEKFKSGDMYQSLESAAATDDDGNPYFKGYYYQFQTASGSAIHLTKNVEIAIRVPDSWGENEIYAVYRMRYESRLVGNNYYKPSELKIEDGYIIFNTTETTGEFYLYLLNEPSDLNLLEDGIYTVKITAMHKSADGRTSMANGALVKDSFLKVTTGEDGSKVKELYMDFQVMYIGDTAGYLSNVGTSDSYGFSNEAAEITWGDTIDYFTVDGSDELLRDEWYKENFGYDVYLVKSAKITLQEYTGEYSTSDLYKNYYPVYFEIPPMDSDPTDGIGVQAVRLMVNNCVKLEDGTVLPTYQKTVLKKAILEGKAIDGTVYTAESFNALQKAITDAETAYSSNPGEEAIKSNADAVQAAINDLVVDESKKADKTALEAKLSEAKAIAGDNYTATSYLNLSTAITAAENVYSKDTATQVEVDAQVDSLRAAIEALVPLDLGAVAPSQLPEGTYTIPIRLWHAIKDQASMGDAAVVSTGILTIQKDENGNKKAALQFEMKPLTFAGLTGYLMQFDTLSGYTIGTGGYPENYTRNPATVLETYDVVDMYNSEDSEDEICRGQKYPKTLQIDVTLPETTGVDYTWVHVYVPVMGELDSGDQEARLRLDYTAVAKKGEPTISLDYASVELTPGATKTLTAALTDSEEAIVWTTDNSAVATVDSNGLVTAIAVGTATVTAAAGNISASCLVTVAAEDTGGGTGGGGTGGSGGTQESLEDGTYNIPVKLWHARKDQASMGNAALVQTAKLVIKDGDGTLYITFKAMSYMGQTGYLGELTPSTVISTYNVVDQFNSEDSTDERCRGIKYPKMLAVPVIPGEEFTDVSVYVPVMGSLGVGEQDARLKLDYSSARYVSSSTTLEKAASDDDLYFEEGEAIEGAGTTVETKYPVIEEGVKYFYENGEKLTSQLITYYGRKYYVGEDGAVLTSQFITCEGKQYYATESGVMATYAMITDSNNKTYYAGKGSVIVTSDMINYKGKYYYAYETGEIATSGLVTYQDDKYYAGRDGAIVTSAMVTYNGKKYYAYRTGIIATSAMVTTNDGKKYYAWKTGRIATSAMVTYKGKKYYAWKTGRIATSAMVTYKGKKYYAWKTGRIATSAMATYKGKKYYAGKTGEAVTSKWVTIGKVKYYFDKTGKLTKTRKI